MDAALPPHVFELFVQAERTPMPAGLIHARNHEEQRHVRVHDHVAQAVVAFRILALYPCFPCIAVNFLLA